MTIRRAAALLLLLLYCLPSTAAAAGRTVTFRTDDGVLLTGTWYEPASRPAPAVVFVHMLRRTRHDWDAVASQLSAAGLGALTFDLRGHGESGGAMPPDTDYQAFLHDVAAARRYVASRPDVVSGKIGLAGASIGANLAVLSASSVPGVTALALLSPSVDYRGLRADTALRKFSGPVLLVAGDDDPYASRSVRDLSKPAGGPREPLILPHAGHGTTMLARSPELTPRLVDWLRRTAG